MQRSNLHNRSDQELFRLMQKSNEFAFDELFKRYWYRFFRIAHSLLRDQEAARDVVQDVFTKFWSVRQQLEVRNVSAYLHQAVKMKCFESLRRQQISQTLMDRYQHMVNGNSTENEVYFSDLEQHYKINLQQLPARTRQVFQLSRVEHLSNQEIAENLNISLKTVEYHITLALKRLRLSLRDFFFLLILTLF